MNNIDVNKSKMIVKKTKPKVLRIRTSEDFIETNLLDLPFCYFYKTKEPVTDLIYTWNGSDGLQRSIEVRSSSKGIPSPYEYDLLIALLRIYIKQNDNKIYVIDEENNTFDIDNKVTFSYRELAKEMGYKSMTPVLKEKLDNSIQRLVDTNIYNSGGGLYNPMTKEYMTNLKFQIGILHNYSSYDYFATDELDESGNPIMKIDRKSIKDRVSVEIDTFFLKNLMLGKGKISDKNLRLSLKLDVSRRLYLLLNKWQNGRKSMYLKYETLYFRIPLTDEKDDYYRKRRLKDALNELKNKGFIIDFEMKNEGVDLVFEKIENIELSLDYTTDSDLLKKYNNYTDVMDKLKEHGITDEVINKHFKLHEMPYIQALLRYIDDVEDTKYKIENKASYIFRCLVEDEKSIDKKYYN